MPPQSRVDVSVARSDGWEEGTGWGWADRWARSPQRPTVFARSDLTSAQVAAASNAVGHALRVEPTEPNPPDHADIANWPSSENKELRDLLAKELAAVASVPTVGNFDVYPSPPLVAATRQGEI